MRMDPFSMLLTDPDAGVKSLLDALPDQFYIKDRHCRFVFANSATASFLQHSLAELIGKTDYDLFPHSLADEFMAEEKELLASGRPLVNREVCIADPTDKLRWELTTKIVLRDDRGQIVGLLGINRDITDHKRAEEQLRLQGEALAAAANAIIITDAAGVIRWVNPAFTKLTGYTADEAIGANPRILKSGQHDSAFYRQMWETIQSGQVWHSDVVNKRKDGRLYVEEMIITPVRNASNAITHFIATKQDVTERRQAQEQLQQLNADLARSQLELLETYENLKHAQTKLIQAEKMEIVGRLAAGVAHEVRNPLAVLAMGLGYIEGNLPPNQPTTTTVVDSMRDAIVRADAIICELLDFSSPRVLDLTDQDVTRLADRSLLLVKHELRRHKIEVVREFAPDLPLQRVDRIRIEQVLVNLLMNAIQAMAEGGRLTVRTLRDATGAVVAEVCDTGPGIPTAQLEKVFTPFFTTKPVGIGTGLGLAVAQSILAQHGGELTVANQSGGGVCARVIFHKADKEADHGT